MNFQPFCYRPDIVFEGRNKAYGAYMIRKIYEKRILTSLLIAIFGFTIAMGGPILYSSLVPETAERNMKEVNLQDVAPPPEEKKPEPPVEVPPPPVDPPKVDQIKFLPPEPVPDKEVVEKLATIEKVEQSNSSDETQKGQKDADLPPPTNTPVETPKIEEKPQEDDKVYYSVQQNPEFEGGLKGLNKYLSKNLKYPKSAIRQGIKGKVIVKFIVGKDGSINNVSLLKGLTGCDECNAEAIRVVSGMPKWKPGRQNGNAVIVQYQVPIKFELED